MDNLLDIRGLTTQFASPEGVVTAVDGVDLSVIRGRALALVGESGSGKSVTCASIVGLPPAGAKIVAGEVRFNGVDLMKERPAALSALRGRRIGMVLQNAMTALNPVLTVGAQLAETFRRHRGVRRRAELRRLSIEALEAVGISGAAERLGSYPFQLSGGMRQRVCIAIAVACEPELLLCDEPTTALDVTVQLQILQLLRNLQRQRAMTVIFVTHDLHVASRFCDDVAVMYAGRIVERGPIGRVFAEPAHPYTEGLLRATPSLETINGRLATLPGQVPAGPATPPGCRFAERCSEAHEQCRSAYPDWFGWDDAGARSAACWNVPRRVHLHASGTGPESARASRRTPA
ncbi:ABC transporter ATP-binding protein [Caballeronia sp. LZ034LL]|uniref:ABC transporter ATP-binding protein n=1 Tax=Caballeronia sp. LZ034LL TaxID=3038567 RepID=UPI002856856B|nr:ABC transporter ATP-binding protein [Caballeronia sp. LZ034LL]MDR5836025.1 ABC transporter ATP-binding protein [Caballeronia sp. LZ034LL]